MRIYVAGPYSAGDPTLNTREAIKVADQLAAAGGFPFVPHLSHLWHLVSPHDYEFWIAQDMEWLEACDAVYRIPGASRGADKEVARAEELGMSVYYNLPLLLARLGSAATEAQSLPSRLQ